LQLSIILLNYNTLDLCRQCIRSIVQHEDLSRWEIIVVDNASAEQGVETLTALSPAVRLIKSDENLGFAGGNNLGLKAAQGDHLLLLNSDTYLQEPAISKTLSYLKSRPNTAVVSPRLVYPDGRHQSVAQRFPSVRYQMFELLRLQKILGAERSGRILTGAFFDHKSTIKADWVWGAFFMFPGQVLEALGGELDASYFMYFEDMQWCMDIRHLGYDIEFFAGAEVVHLMGGSSAAKEDLMKESKSVFLKKNYNRLHAGLIKLLERWLQR